MIKASRFLLIYFLLAYGCGVNAQYTWRHKACLPAPGRIAPVFSLGTNAYILGNDNGTPELWMYNTITNTWTQKNDFPGAASFPSVFVINDTAYAGLGLDASGALHTDFYKYYAAVDFWAPVASLPGLPRYTAMSFVINGKAYLGCGFNGIELNDFYEYNPVANTWTQLPNFPGQPRQSGFSVSNGVSGFMGLGFNGNNDLTDCYRYNPVTATWSSIANFPGVPRATTGAFIINDTIYIAAGGGDNRTDGIAQQEFADCWAYSIQNNNWFAQPGFECIAPGRGTGGGVTIAGHGYLISGRIDTSGYYPNDLLEFGPYDTTFTNRVYVLGNDTVYCGPFTRTLTVPDLCAVWSTGVTGPSITVDTLGTYWVKLNDSCGVGVDTINIVQRPGVSVNLGNDTTLCTGASLLLNATNANSTYAWQNQSTNATFNVTSTGTYAVTVTNAFLCTATDSITVNFNLQKPQFSLGPDTVYCRQFSRVLSTGIDSTFWSTNTVGPFITINTPGIYRAQASNACGTTTDSVSVTESAPPPVAFTGSVTVCPGDTILLQPNTTANNFLWNTADTTAYIQVTAPGTYTVRVWNNIACPDSATYTIPMGSPPVITLGNDTTICGDGFTLALNVPNAHYTWQDSTTNNYYNVTQTGIYSVTVTTHCGTTTAQREVAIFPDPCEVAIPNSFTPNGDGKNDIFNIISLCPVTQYHMHIYNRWGQLVFQSDNYNTGWDGRFQGVEQPIGTYIYYVQYFNYCTNAIYSKSGSLTLLR